MNSALDPSIFPDSANFRDSEFQDILIKIVCCYRMMLSDKIKVTKNENQIRDKLLINYLRNDEIRNKIKLTNYLFDREVPEDNTKGRTDIKVQTRNTFLKQAAYYIIECKRLDDKNLNGTTGLNAEYIKNGIMRFVGGQYSTNKHLNGMIGFVIESINISCNIRNINNLLVHHFPDANTLNNLTPAKFIKDFEHSYYSMHKNKNNCDCIMLYHLMFDFSANLDEEKDR
jgi:hypothetical protein